MTDSLQDVIAAAVDGAADKAGPADGVSRRVPLLRAVQTPQLAAVRSAPAAPPPTYPLTDPAPLGRSGLRMAFWLCGFHETIRERQQRGETLNQRETSLLALSSKDFASIRPTVIGMAIEHLKAVLGHYSRRDAAPGGRAPSEMEAFALESVCSLSLRASELLRDDGPDTALSLFGGDASVQEPLAIYQLVFSTVVSLAESFRQFIPKEAAVLQDLIETLGSEVERI